MRAGFRLSEIDHPRIETEIQRLLASPAALNDLLERAGPYLYYIVGAVEAAELPGEIALLPAVESGFRPYVYSPDGAAGLWQFMPATGDMMGLEQDWWFDSRRTVRASTTAATAYLQKMNDRFDGDWLHALAAYNAGAGTVGKAIRRAEQRSEPTDFWSLDLPGETDRYVPRLLALARIVQNPARYGIALPAIPDSTFFTVVDTPGQIDLNVVADTAGLPVEQLLLLNAGHRRWATRPDGPHEVLVPVSHADCLRQKLAALPEEQRVRWKRHAVARGESLYAIARLYGVSIAAIQSSNALSGATIRTGDELVIPLSEFTAPKSVGSNGKAQQRLHYRVQKGDSLYRIAQRFQVSIGDLKRWNQVGKHIKPGEQLTVFIDPDA